MTWQEKMVSHWTFPVSVSVALSMIAGFVSQSWAVFWWALLVSFITLMVTIISLMTEYMTWEDAEPVTEGGGDDG